MHCVCGFVVHPPKEIISLLAIATLHADDDDDDDRHFWGWVSAASGFCTVTAVELLLIISLRLLVFPGKYCEKPPQTEWFWLHPLPLVESEIIIQFQYGLLHHQSVCSKGMVLFSSEGFRGNFPCREMCRIRSVKLNIQDR